MKRTRELSKKLLQTRRGVKKEKRVENKIITIDIK